MAKLSPAGLHLIASFEGFVPTPYNDAAGNATIGYGHLIHLGHVTAADRRDWPALTHEHALELLHTDAAAAELAVTAGVRVRLGIIPARADARFSALCSLAFNIGAGAFKTSTVLRLVNAKPAPRDWTEPATAMLAWCHAGGKIVPGLLARRRIEAAALIAGRLPTLWPGT